MDDETPNNYESPSPRTFSDIFTALRTSRFFWFKRVYAGTSVPLPLLCLGGPGAEPVDVGLPVTASILEDLQDAGLGRRCGCCAAHSRAGQGADSDSDSRSGLGSWVVDGAQMTFENVAEWDAFVDEVGAQLRAVLGLGLPEPPQNATNINGSKHRTVARKGKGAHGQGAQDPRMKPELEQKLKPKLNLLRLRSLVLSGAGAAGSCETHAPTALQCSERERVLATALVVLPSEYKGTGAGHISHGEATVEHDLSSSGLTSASPSSGLCNTTVIAWRAGDPQTQLEPGETRETRETTVRVDPIVEGCRASLVYDLVDTSGSPGPPGSLSLLPQVSVDSDSDSDVRARLERALHSWARTDLDLDVNANPDANATRTLVHLLEGTYPRTNLSARDLPVEGGDARLVALLDAVGAPLGVRVGLASVTGTRVGVVYDEGERELLGTEDASTAVEVENLVALDGAFVRERVMEMRGGRVVDAGDDRFVIVPTRESFVHVLFGREEAEERVGGISERSVECEYHGTALVLWR